MIVGVLTPCRTQYTWDRSICILLFNGTALQVFVAYLTGALYVHPLWFYKHQHDNRVRSELFLSWQRWWFQWWFWFVPSVPGYLREEEEHEPLDSSVQLHTACYLQCIVYDKLLNTDNHFELLCVSYLRTYSMVQSPSWEANWFAASQEIPRISRNPKVHYRTHKRTPPVSILGQPNPVHIPTSHLLEIHPNIIHPSMPRSPQWSPSLRFPHQDPIHPLSSPILATSPAHLILLDFITRTILSEEYKSFSSSLCNLLHSAVTSSLLGPNILLNTMFWNTLSFLSSRNVSDQVSHPYKTTGKIIVLYILIFKLLDTNLEDKSFCTEC